MLEYGEELSQYNIDSALSCSSISIKIGKKLRDTSVIGQGYILFGYSALAKAEYKTALQSFLTAHDLFKKSNNKGKLAQCYTAIGIVYWYQGVTEKAIYYYKKNIALSIEINDENGLAASYGNLAIIFDENKDFENALQYYNSAFVIFEKKKR